MKEAAVKNYFIFFNICQMSTKIVSFMNVAMKAQKIKKGMFKNITSKN